MRRDWKLMLGYAGGRLLWTCGRTIGIAAAIVLVLITAWTLVASGVWSWTTGHAFSPWGWWIATKFWSSNIPSKLWLSPSKLWLSVSAAFGILIDVYIGVAIALFLRRRSGVRRRMSASAQAQPGGFFSRPKATAPPAPPKPRASIHGITDNHGHSHWRSVEGILKRFDGPVRPHGGMVVGELYRPDLDHTVDGIEFDPRTESSWGMGGTQPLIIDSCIKGARAWHSGEFGPSGSGKTSELITKVLTWTGSSVVYDPKVEIGPKLDRVLRRHFRKRVFHIGLPDPSKDVRFTGFNILKSSIDITHPEADLQVRRVVARVYDEAAATAEMEKSIGTGSSDPYWGLMGRALVTALLSHVAWTDPEVVEISLRTVMEIISRPERDLLSALRAIYTDSDSSLARREAGSLMDSQALTTFSSIRLNAVSGLQWLFSKAIVDLLSVGDFDPQWLLLGNCAVFLSVHLTTVQAAPMIPQVLVGSIVDAIITANGEVRGLIGIFIDEFDHLKRLHVLQTLRDMGREYNAVMHCCWQSLGQLFATWGEQQARAWLESFSWVAFVGQKAFGGGKELSPALGTHGVLAYSEGDNHSVQQPVGLRLGSTSQGQTVNVHELSHALKTAVQLQQDLDAKCLVVVPDYGMPMLVGRAFWWWRRDLAALIKRY